MPKGLKIALFILGVLILLGGGCVAAIAMWVQSNLPEIEKMGKVVTAEGEAFGAESDGTGCVTEALRRGDACDGIMCEAGASIFLRSCLDAATVAPEFCEGVPSTDSIIGSVRFRLAKCEEVGASNVDRCGRIVDSIQEYCHQPASSERSESTSRE